MRAKLLAAYLQSWQRRHDDGIEHINTRTRELYVSFGWDTEKVERMLDYERSKRRYALAVARQLAPHFPEHYVEYGGDMAQLNYRDKSVAWIWRPCATWSNETVYMHGLEHPHARQMVNKALAVRGHSARVGWRDGAPTVSEGYRIEQTIGGSYQIYPL